MSSKGMLEGGKNQKIMLLKNALVFHCNPLSGLFFFFSFLHILSSLTPFLVIFQQQAIMFWLENVMVTRDDKRHKVLHVGTTKSFIIARQNK